MITLQLLHVTHPQDMQQLNSPIEKHRNSDATATSNGLKPHEILYIHASSNFCLILTNVFWYYHHSCHIR